MPWQPVLLIITGIFALIMQMIYFLLDDREVNHTPLDLKLKKYWHWAGGLIHVWMGIAMTIMYGWQWGLLMAAATWEFFDGLINTFVLKREWWYIGTTSLIDNAQQKIAKIIHIDGRLLSAIIKILFLGICMFFVAIT